MSHYPGFVITTWLLFCVGDLRAETGSTPEAPAAEDEVGPTAPSQEDASGVPGAKPPDVPWNDDDVRAWLRAEGLTDADRAGQARFSLGGFADVSFHLEATDGHTHGEFHIGQLVLHGLADLTEGFSAFIEVSVNSEPTWETRVERLLLSWELNDHLKLSLGRHHIPVTWWNTTFHHGLWLQTTVRRPVAIGYDDAFIPNHAIGLMAEGKVPGLGDIGLRYQLGVSGGGDDHLHGASDSLSDDHSNLRTAWSATLALEPPAIPMLRVGAVVFGDPDRQREGRRVDELSVGAHIAYTAEEPELIAELVYVRHDAAAMPDGTGAGSFEHWSWYVQAAWRLPGAWSDLKPYLRYERLLLDEAEDPTLADATGIEVVLGGVRWDVTPWLALKLETSWRKRDGSSSLLESIIQANSTW